MKYDPSRKLIPGVPGQRDIMVIDHNRQCWVRIKFIDALRVSGWFGQPDKVTRDSQMNDN